MAAIDRVAGKGTGMADQRKLTGFGAERSERGFVIHIVDDQDEVFEIRAGREHLELIIDNLRAVLAGEEGGDAHARD